MPSFRQFAVASGALLSTLASATSNVTCYNDGVFVLVSRGSDETQGDSVLEEIATPLKAAIGNSGGDEVVYPAWASFWDSAPTGVTNMQEQLTDYYAACPDGKIVVMGYSQGAYVVSAGLAGGNFSEESWSALPSDLADNIISVITFGDPSRIEGLGTAQTGTNCEVTCTSSSPLDFTGSDSSLEAYGSVLQNWCDNEDDICCSTGTGITAHLDYWSTNTTDTVIDFVMARWNGSDATSSSSSSSSSASSAASSTASSYASSASSGASAVVTGSSNSTTNGTTSVTGTGSKALSASASATGSSGASAASASASSSSSSSSSSTNAANRADVWAMATTSSVALFSIVLFLVV